MISTLILNYKYYINGCEAEMMSMLATKLPDGVDPDVAAGCHTYWDCVYLYYY